MITKTIGPTGDFTTIAGWVSWVVANATSGGNLTDDVTGNIQAAGITLSGNESISGWAANGFTTTLGADSGSPAPYAGQSIALMWNTANGYFIDGAGGDFHLTVAVDKFIIKDLQVKLTGAYAVGTLNFTSISSPTSVLVDRCIIDTYQGVTGAIDGCNNLTVRNSLLRYTRDSISTQGVIANAVTGGTVTIQDCTLLSGDANMSLLSGGSYGIFVLNGCAFFTINQLGAPFNVRMTNLSGSNNGTSGSAWTSTFGGSDPFTSSQFSMSAGTELSGGASFNDFRVKNTSTQLKDNGVAIGGISADIVGTTRPQGATPDIGAWEFVQTVSSTLMPQACL